MVRKYNFYVSHRSASHIFYEEVDELQSFLSDSEETCYSWFSQNLVEKFNVFDCLRSDSRALTYEDFLYFPHLLLILDENRWVSWKWWRWGVGWKSRFLLDVCEITI